jgi:hypothetical protein
MARRRQPQFKKVCDGGDYEEVVLQWMAEDVQPKKVAGGGTSGGASAVLCSPLDLFTKGEHKDKPIAKQAVVEMKDGNYMLTEESIKELGKKVGF